MRAALKQDTVDMFVWDHNWEQSNMLSALVDAEIIYDDNNNWWIIDRQGRVYVLCPTDIVMVNKGDAFMMADRDFRDNFYTTEDSMLCVLKSDTLEFCRWHGFGEDYPDWMELLIEEGMIHEYYRTSVYSDETGGMYGLREDGSDIFILGPYGVKYMPQRDFQQYFVEVE